MCVLFEGAPYISLNGEVLSAVCVNLIGLII